MERASNNIERRKVLQKVGTVGVAGVFFTGSTKASQEDNSDGDTNISEQSQIEPASRIPGVSHNGTYSYGDICWAAGGACTAMASPASAVAAKACKISGSTCFILGALDRMGCSDADLELYTIDFAPVPFRNYVIPSCIRENTYSLVLDMLEDYGVDPWNMSPLSPHTGDQPRNNDIEGVEISEEFIEEYDAEDLVEKHDAETF